MTAQAPRFVIFGETHGTNEAPAFFGEVACALAGQGAKVLVAIEHSATNNEALQAAWKLSTDDFPEALLQTGWIGRTDGVASEAMFAMVRRLHALKEAGYAIDIVAFNGARDDAQREQFAHLPAQGPHEAAQAENIVEAAGRAPFDRVLVLVGALHAESGPIDLGRGEFMPMAGVLRERADVMTLKMTHDGGTSWNCVLSSDITIEPDTRVTHDMLDCASHKQRGVRSAGDTGFIELGTEAASGFDGEFYVGPVTGSPPAAWPEDRPEKASD